MGRRQRRAGIQRVFVERPPMKGETSIVYHARFEAEVSPQVKLFGRARGTRIMDPNRRLLSSTPFPLL